MIYYRSGEVIRNSILSKSPLPNGYIAGGNFDTDCKDIGSEVTPEIASCEDAAFWDLHDASGKLTERRLVLGCDPNRHNWNTVMGPLRNPDPRATLWLYSESLTPSPKPHSHPASTKEKATSLLDRIRGTANKKAAQDTTTKPATDTTPKPPKLQKLELKNYPEGHDFHPLGLEIWPSYGGNGSYLYAVNHARARTVIEQFLLDPAEPDAATYIRTISHSWFISPNALALTSPDSFYVSNDHFFTRRLPIIGHFVPIIETLLGLPFSFVAHVTLNPPSAPPSAPTILEHTIEAPFIPFSNGVSVSPDGSEVAIASTTLNRVLFYTRDKLTNRLTYNTAVPVPFCPDNIRYNVPNDHNDDDNEENGGDAATELVVAGHPHFPSVAQVAANKPGAVGQSWIVSIKKRAVSSS